MSKPAMACGDFNALVSARHGHMLVNRNDMYIGRSILELGEFSEGEVDLFRQVVRPGSMVVEVGANIGTHTVPLAKLAGPTGHVLAIEPQRIVFQTLCANCALNSLTNVTTIWAAAGAAPGHVFVPNIDYSRNNNFGGLGLEGRTEGERVQVLTIDSFGLTRLDFLKADVEGMENAVLIGAKQTIERCRPLMYVENDRKEKSEELLATIKSMGYRAFAHSPPLFNPNNFFETTQNPFDNIVSMNVLAVHASVAADIKGMPEL